MNLQSAYQLLQKALGAYPEREASLALALLSKICGRSLSYLTPKQASEKIDKKQVDAFIFRLSQSEPVEYLLEELKFASCIISVEPGVLIPRPETELLVEKIIKALSKEDLSNKILVDFCTGTGCIALALKKHFPDLEVWGVDLSDQALLLAKRNALQNNLTVNWCKLDLLKENLGFEFDYMVSNPPYIPKHELLELEPSVLLFEPALALDGGEDGLLLYRELARSHFKSLKMRGKLFLELGYNQGKSVKEIFDCEGFKNSCYEKDFSGHDRFFFLERE